MEENTTSNILPFKAKDSNQSSGLTRTLTPKEAHTLSMLIRQVSGEMKSEEAEIFEITQRVFGVGDLSHIPAKDLGAVTKFLEGIVKSSAAAKS